MQLRGVGLGGHTRALCRAMRNVCQIPAPIGYYYEPGLSRHERVVRVCVCYAFVITVRRFLRVRGRVCIYAETMYRASGVRIPIHVPLRVYIVSAYIVRVHYTRPRNL